MHPNDPVWTPEIMLRLGQLLFESASERFRLQEEAWEKELAVYREREDAGEKVGDAPAAPEESLSSPPAGAPGAGGVAAGPVAGPASRARTMRAEVSTWVPGVAAAPVRTRAEGRGFYRTGERRASRGPLRTAGGTIERFAAADSWRGPDP